MLIYFIHHTATAIQLPAVIASIARDLARAIDTETALASPGTGIINGPSGGGHFASGRELVSDMWKRNGLDGACGTNLRDRENRSAFSDR